MRTRHPRNGTLLSDARRVRFGEKITSEAVKGRLLLILILIISARAQNVKESGFEFCNFTVSSMQTTLWSGCGCDGRRAAIGDIFVCGKGAPERTALEPSSEAGRLNGKERRRVMLCAQADSDVFSHKRAITFERLYTGTKVFLCPPARILMTSLPICPALFAVIRVRSATCSPLAAKTSMPVLYSS